MGAPAFSGSGVGLTGVAKLTANTFTATQTIDGGNLDLDPSTATAGNITKNGTGELDLINNSNNTFTGSATIDKTLGAPPAGRISPASGGRLVDA